MERLLPRQEQPTLFDPKGSVEATQPKLTIGAAEVSVNPVLNDIAASELPRPPEKEATSELADLASQAATVLKDLEDLELICGGADKVPPRMKAAYESLRAGLSLVQA